MPHRPSISFAPYSLVTFVLLASLAPASVRAQAATGSLEGSVRSAADGSPVSAATVEIQGTDISVATGDDGAFSVTGVPSGSATVTVSRLGFATATEAVYLAPEETVRLRITLSEEAVEMRGIVVTGRRGYYDASRANSATRSNTPIFETPVSVQVVPRQLLVDQAATELEDVYKNISGVTESGATLNASTVVQPHLRGFIAETFLRDGQRTTIAGSGAIDLVDVESVEVLKGPASILYGSLQPGGVINYVTEQPLPVAQYSIEQEFGSYDHFRTTFDATGPIGSDRVSYRLNGAYTDAESFRNEIFTERLTISPALRIRPSQTVTLDFDGSFSREERPYDTGIPFMPNGEPVSSVETFFGEPTLNPREMDFTFVSTDLRWQARNALQLRSTGSYQNTQSTHEAIRPRGVVVDEGTGEAFLRRRFQTQDEDTEQWQVITDLTGSFATGALDHDLSVGLEIQSVEARDTRFRQNLPNIPLGQNPRGYEPPDYTLPDPTVGKTDWVAVFAQDQVALLDDRLHVLLSGRYDAIDQSSTDPGDPVVEFSDEKLTGRIGVLAEVASGFAPFVSLSQSFNPQTPGVVDAEGDPLAPEEGSQIEGGLKYEDPSGRFSASLAGFQIGKENVAVFNSELFADEGIVSFLPEVEQETRGLELDVAGEVTAGLNAIANFTYIDTEVTASPDESAVGRALGGVPPRSAAAWLSYTFGPGSRLADLTFGGGVRYEAEHEPSFPGDLFFELDSFTVADLSARYRLVAGAVPIGLRINVDNVFDTQHFIRANDLSIVHPGAPRTFRFGVSVDF